MLVTKRRIPGFDNDVPVRVFNDTPPLHLALRNPDVDVDLVREILMGGADVNDTDLQGMTPLMMAVCLPGGDVDVVRALLESGAAVNARQWVSNLTPLLMTLLNPDVDVRLVRALLAGGANVHHHDHDGDTALVAALRHPQLDAAVIWALLEGGANVNAYDRAGRTPLMLAVKRQYVRLDLVRELIARGADVNARDQRSKRPLHLAVRRYPPDLEIVRELIRAGARVGDVDGAGHTPLMVAVCDNYGASLGLVRELVKRGVDVNARNDLGLTALAMSLFHPDVDVMVVRDFLNRRSTDVPLPQIYMALSGGDPFVFSDLEVPSPKEVALPATPGQQRPTPPRLTDSQVRHAVAVARELIGAGALVNAEDCCGYTPLHYALAYSPAPQIVRLLLEKGARLRSVKNLEAVVSQWDLDGQPHLRDTLKVITKYDLVEVDDKEKVLFLPSKCITSAEMKLLRELQVRTKTDGGLLRAVLTGGKVSRRYPLNHIIIKRYKPYHKPWRFDANEHLDFAFIANDARRCELEQYRKDCMSELRRMQEDKLYLTLSMWDFFFNHDTRPNFMPFVELHVLDIYKSFVSKPYLIYKDILYRTWPKSFWMEVIGLFRIYSVDAGSGKTVALNGSCSQVIGSYLSREDLMNVVLVFCKV